MSAHRYGTVLTVLLVIVIIALIAGVGVLVYNVVKKNNEEVAVAKAIDDLDKGIDEWNKGKDKDKEKIETPEIPEGGSGGKGSSSAGSNLPKKQYYQNYVTIGYIEISKTGVKLPILEKGSDKALDVSVAVMYPDDAILKLNTPGNIVIMGHNYRNGKFFSNNKKLVTGDKIRITGYNNGTLTYTIYEIFETTPGDTSYISRDTNGETEITLSTCTDNGARRLIIKARV